MASMTSATGRRDRADLPSISVPWWLYLITAAAWFVIAWVVLRFDLTSVVAVSILAGVVILTAGVAELFNAFTAPGWKWLHALLGGLFIVTSAIAFFQPGGTFAMLAAFVGWYLLFKGLFDIVLAFATKAENDAWWLLLVVGIIEVILGFWAAGRFGRSVALLIVFIGAIALTRGITDIVLAFRLRQIQHGRAESAALAGSAGVADSAALAGADRDRADWERTDWERTDRDRPAWDPTNRGRADDRARDTAELPPQAAPPGGSSSGGAG
jgi:uncharacterized membrane protein HdeD (DUF308 family)